MHHAVAPLQAPEFGLVGAGEQQVERHRKLPISSRGRVRERRRAQLQAALARRRRVGHLKTDAEVVGCGRAGPLRPAPKIRFGVGEAVKRQPIARGIAIERTQLLRFQALHFQQVRPERVAKQRLEQEAAPQPGGIAQQQRVGPKGAAHAAVAGVAPDEGPQHPALPHGGGGQQRVIDHDERAAQPQLLRGREQRQAFFHAQLVARVVHVDAEREFVQGLEVDFAQGDQASGRADAEGVQAAVGHHGIGVALVDGVNVTGLPVHVHRHRRLHPPRIHKENRHLRQPTRRGAVLVKGTSFRI